VAWGESNAIVFANSVLGARTNRYGDFADLACAITGRAPYSGLHTDSGRRATDLVDLRLLPDAWLDEETFYPVLGYWIGSKCGTGVPAIVGLDIRADEDRLKAIGAAAASSGATAMFHAVGVTPEAPDVDAVTRGDLVRTHDVQPADITRIRSRLGAEAGPIAAVSVGTPHMSLDELQCLADLVSGRRARVPFYANTARDTVARLSQQRLRSLESFGVTLVTDTCTYITPIIGDVEGAVMTNSGNWAYYAPGNLGVDVVFAGLAECVDSAENGSAVLGALFT
jgi:predicted aconitase